MPVTFVHGLATIQVVINGHPLRMILDTGGVVSILTPEALKKISSFTVNSLPLTLLGFNGDFQSVPTFVHPFQLDDLKVENEAFWVAKLGDRSAAAFDGTIGEDVLNQWNIDLNFPQGNMALFEENGCARTPPGGGVFAQERFSPGANQAPVFPFYVDNQKFYGSLDSGSVRTVMSADALAHRGVAPTRIYRVVRTIGLGGREGQESIAQFADLTIGGEDFGAAWFEFAKSDTFKPSWSPYGLQTTR